ncbi:hypothetical protein Vafri_19031 [Volvox africanus]|uniref:Uncharacterized protein n=1 Tax=Volvox africanus TaxID=51714 RepID=A0A8J4FCI4_9CHLO|nr:hypothetical protein Vafri_19031 [Volvox africanus]
MLRWLDIGWFIAVIRCQLGYLDWGGVGAYGGARAWRQQQRRLLGILKGWRARCRGNRGRLHVDGWRGSCGNGGGGVIPGIYELLETVVIEGAELRSTVSWVTRWGTCQVKISSGDWWLGASAEEVVGGCLIRLCIISSGRLKGQW